MFTGVGEELSKRFDSMTNDFKNYENCSKLENQCKKECLECENIILWMKTSITDLHKQIQIEDYCQMRMRECNDYPSIAKNCEQKLENIESELHSKYVNLGNKEAISNNQFDC